MGMTSEEFHRSLDHIAENHLDEMRHIRERRAINAAHHNEMMELLDRLQALKMEYKKLGEAYDGISAQKKGMY